MPVSINVVLRASNKVQRTDGHGNTKILYEADFETTDGRKMSAIVFFPVARAMKYLKPNDKLDIGVVTHVHKWANSLGDVDLVTENTVIYIERTA